MKLGIKFRKAFCVSLALLICLSLFTTWGSASADCGKRCCKGSVTWDYDPPAGAKADYLPLGCCAETHEIPCGFAKSQPSDLPKYITAIRIEAHDSSGTIFIIDDTLFDNYYAKGFGLRLHAMVPTRHSPIYLENLSLLC